MTFVLRELQDMATLSTLAAAYQIGVVKYLLESIHFMNHVQLWSLKTLTDNRIQMVTAKQEYGISP